MDIGGRTAQRALVSELPAMSPEDLARVHAMAARELVARHVGDHTFGSVFKLMGMASRHRLRSAGAEMWRVDPDEIGLLHVLSPAPRHLASMHGLGEVTMRQVYTALKDAGLCDKRWHAWGRLEGWKQRQGREHPECRFHESVQALSERASFGTGSYLVDAPLWWVLAAEAEAL